MQTKKTRNLVMISLLAAMSFVLMYVVQIPLLPVAPFLKWDPSDLPNVLGGLVLGPGAAFLIALIKCLLFLLLKGSEGPIGAFMAFASSVALAVPCCIIYRRWSSHFGFLFSLLISTAVLTLTMGLVNYYWALGVWGIPAEQRLPLLQTAILPFNVLRGVISSALIYPVYLALRQPLTRFVLKQNRGELA
ncbi:MAG TPA: ECF transporter S component [Firmicutes bacterium]|nr:ECF transporter S component [Bacillota bacterium]